jgi:hypothetical protein
MSEVSTYDNDRAIVAKLVAEQGLFKVLDRFVDRMEIIVDEVRKEVESQRDKDLLSVLAFFVYFSPTWDRLKEMKKKYDEMYDVLSIHVIPDKMRDANVKTVNLAIGYRVTVSARFSCTMLDKEAGLKWLEDTGNESLIQRTVNSSSLAAFAKNLIMEEGKELPEDIFKTSSTPYTSLTKVK